MIHSRHFDTTTVPQSSVALRVTPTELTHLLDISPDALLIVDPEGTIVMANAQAAALFGYCRVELQQQRLEMLLPEPLHALHVAHRQHYVATPRTRTMEAEHQLWGQHKDGTEFPLDIRMRPVLLGDELLTIGAIRDMSLQRHIEFERMQQAEHLRLQVNAIALDSSQEWHAVRQPTGPLAQHTQHADTAPVALVIHQDVSALKEAEYLKDEFISVAAHELRNPLAVLKGFAEMLVYQTARGKGAKLAPWQTEALEEIDTATARLDKLTEDLLDVTRLQAGRLVLSCTPTDLVTLTRHVVAQRQMTTRHHTISLDTEHAFLVVEVDRERIEQVLTNLLSNAIKYSPQGGPIELTIREEAKPHTVLISIRDLGMGIPSVQQAHIFWRFVRAENARASEITGTGLGLFLSRELVERHGGRLWFESTEGAGSTFFMALPMP